MESLKLIPVARTREETGPERVKNFCDIYHLRHGSLC